MGNQTTLYIARHGQTEWNVAHKLQGHQDSALTKLGIQQAEWLGESLQDVWFDLIYASSSERAFKTAEIIRGDRSINILASDDLKEINLGAWEGMTQDEAKELYPEQHHYFWKDPEKFAVQGSETFMGVSERAVGKNKLWDLPYIHPACLCKVEVETGRPQIVLHGDISHYKELPGDRS